MYMYVWDKGRVAISMVSPSAYRYLLGERQDCVRDCMLGHADIYIYIYIVPHVHKFRCLCVCVWVCVCVADRFCSV